MPTDWRYSGVVTAPDGCLWTFAGDIIVRACLPGPRITNVTSTYANGMYSAGNTIPINVTFTTPVTVTGIPSLSLNSGGSAVYATGSGTNVLTFNYTVGSGESTARLDPALVIPNLPLSFSGQVMAVKLNGGAIRDSSGNNSLLLTPVTPAPGSLAVNKQIVITPDAVAPVSEATASPDPNGNGWNKDDVTVTISATDFNGSGVKQIQYSLAGAQNSGLQVVPGSSTTVLVNTEGVTTVSYSARDNAGNVEVAKTLTIRLDKSAPMVTFNAATPPPNAAGWINATVMIAFTVSDSLSGVDSVTPASPLTLRGEGGGLSGVVTATDLAGNTTSATSPQVNIDRTPPVISGIAPAPNAFGWHNTPVTVNFSCNDALSGLAAGSPPAGTVLTSDGADQSVIGVCNDVAGNSASVTVSGINVDRTPPTVAASALPPPNANGWNNSNVTVSFVGTDTLSGIDSCTPPAVLSAEGSGQSASGTCSDKAGNVSTSASAGRINIDKTAPTLVFGAAGPAPNAAGWNNTSVSIPFTAMDAVSGVASTIPAISPLVLTPEGAAVAGAVTVTDRAGNTATFSSQPAKIDKTPPVLLSTRSPAPNAYGWNNTDVTVALTCSDSLSGVASLTPGPAVVVSSEGANQSVPGACQDWAGNVMTVSAGPVNLDKTKPVVSSVSANPSAVPPNNGFTLNATVRDDVSGSSSVECRVDNGSYLPMTQTGAAWSASVPALPLGVHEMGVRATDRAGNPGDEVSVLMAVYDANGGFVTGGGWIDSPAGAYASNPALKGKANFDLASRYEKGAKAPSGDLTLRFPAAGLTFRSTSYEWLVVAGASAQFKGSGTINGTGSYDFLVTAIDGAMPAGGGVDKLRIKIWGPSGIVYDNQMGASTTGNAAIAIGGGNIVIHP